MSTMHSRIDITYPEGIGILHITKKLQEIPGITILKTKTTPYHGDPFIPSRFDNTPPVPLPERPKKKPDTTKQGKL